MLHVDAKNINCAYKWLEWSLNPKLQIALAELSAGLAALIARGPIQADRALIQLRRFGRLSALRLEASERSQRPARVLALAVALD